MSRPVFVALLLTLVSNVVPDAIRPDEARPRGTSSRAQKVARRISRSGQCPTSATLPNLAHHRTPDLATDQEVGLQCRPTSERLTVSALTNTKGESHKTGLRLRQDQPNPAVHCRALPCTAVHCRARSCARCARHAKSTSNSPTQNRGVDPASRLKPLTDALPTGQVLLGVQHSPPTDTYPDIYPSG